MSRQQRRAEERKAEKSAANPAPNVAADDCGAADKSTIHWSDLNERQKAGFAYYSDWQREGKRCIPVCDEFAIWFGTGNRAYRVERAERNKRGTLVMQYRCACPDFIKNGAKGCKHIFADKLRRNEVTILGIPPVKETPKKATRRPKRRRKAYDGRAIESVQRDARVAMANRIADLIVSLGKGYQRHSAVAIPAREQTHPGGKNVSPHITRAQALIHKLANGLSADAMIEVYGRLIEEGKLRLDSSPHQNTLTDWMNDERLTPVLRELLHLTSLPFRKREIGGIIDSTKISQLRNAHSRWVDYEGDERPSASWMKCHTIVGVETMVVMEALFSESFGDTTHDINFVRPLVEKALKNFSLHYVIADKAYLSTAILDWLWERSIRAAVQLKKGWCREGDAHYSDAVNALVHWYDRNNNRDFQEVYRLRPKVEALFSLLKRMASEHVWSRGRHNSEATNSDATVCTAWINETLCKFIYVNLRATVTLEHETGVHIDYLLPERHFPAPNDPLLRQAA